MVELCAVQLEQFSPVQFSLLIDYVVRGRGGGDMTDDSAEIPF